MEVVPKYFSLLESLMFEDNSILNSTSSNGDDPNRIETNLLLIRAQISIDHQELLQKMAAEFQMENNLQLSESFGTIGKYKIYLEHILLQLVQKINFQSDDKDDLISTKYLNICIKAIKELALYSLTANLHPLIRSNSIFAPKKIASVTEQMDHIRLKLSLEIFSCILSIKYFHTTNEMLYVCRDYIASIFSLFIAQSLNECQLNDNDIMQLQKKLDLIWAAMRKTEYFRTILMLKSCAHLPLDIQKCLHRELLRRLSSTNGFVTLLGTLLNASHQGSHGEIQNCKQTFEIIANIAANKSHTKRFQYNMMEQLWEFISSCLLHKNETLMDSMGAGLLALRRLYDMNKDNREYIKKLLRKLVEQLVQPTDLLTGLVLMEYDKFSMIITQLFHLFCTSSVECLPSELLIPFLPLLLQLFDALPPNLSEQKQVAQLVIRCLDNRGHEQLHEIIEKLYNQNFDKDWLKLHERVLIQTDDKQQIVHLKIASIDYKRDFNISLYLPELLISNNHNILIYQVFMSLLRHMDNCLRNAKSSISDIDLLQTEDELITFLNAKYPMKLEILLSLNTLVSNDGLKTQLTENHKEFSNFLKQLLDHRIVNSNPAQYRNAPLFEAVESADQTLLILLTLAEEVLTNSQRIEQWHDFIPRLKSLSTQTPNYLVKQRVDSLLVLLEPSGDFKANSMPSEALTQYSIARTLLESSESYLQVYGIEKFINLIRQRDPAILANSHAIIALALTTLKTKESYTFLNCVRLFVALLDIKEVDILELLSDEYLNEKASLDFRLVVGEAILKVGQELGPLSYKYRQVLLNCFMHGARSRIDEFRWSSLSNLSQLCRILSYQVHAFFNELISLVDNELTTGKYLPTKRAAVLMMSELLEGMDNILDFEEMLLPIYRLLRHIEADERADEKMRLHAMNGLKALSEKCLNFLYPKQELKKPIKILNVIEDLNCSPKGYTFKMN